MVAATVVLARGAYADDELTEARRLEAALDYAGALVVVDRTLARGGADPGRYVELHLLAGRLAAGLDRPQVAEDHFARVLALAPATTLPEGTSPKLTAPFETARARSIPLRVHVTSVRGLVTIHLDADRLGLVSGIRVHVVDGTGTHGEVTDRRSPRIGIPAGTTAVEVAALDASGNRIWIGPAPAEAAAGGTPPPQAIVRGEPSLIMRWPTWAVVTGVVAATGGFAAWKFRDAQDEWDAARADGMHDFSELQEIEQRGKRWGMTANIAFGVAAATGIATIVLLVRGEDEPALGVGAGPGAGLSVGGRF